MKLRLFFTSLLMSCSPAMLVTTCDAFPFSNGSRGHSQFRLNLVKALQAMPHYECATAAVMAGFGDLLAQLSRHRKEHHQDASLTINYKRTVQFMMKGFGEGLLWTIWYRIAERWTIAITASVLASTTGWTSSSGSRMMTTVVATIVAIVLDLTLACPIIYATWDIPFPAVLRGTPVGQIPRQIRQKIGAMLMASIKVWTPVNVLIYNLPVQYRVYVSSFADVFWQSIVSSIVSSSSSTGDVSRRSPIEATPA